MKKLRYIGVYDTFHKDEVERDCSLAAVKKMNYVISSLNEMGTAVEVVSMARNKQKSQKFERINNINGKNKLLLFPSLGSKNKFLSRIGEIQIRFNLFWWLLRRVKKGEKILVYHSPRLFNAIYFASKIKKIKYILEIEELYYKFGFASQKEKKKELRLIENAFKLIVSTRNIVNELDYKGEYVELYGNYENLVKSKKYNVENKSEYKVVFAGGIETVRNTAFNVCKCAEYLEECFKIYLLGYGDENAISKLKIEINKINTKIGEEKILYCGTKLGKEYDEFMQDCDIAINFQNMDEYYMKFAFPSKVLNYLNYNLLVVTTPLETIRNSSINDLVYYPENMNNTPEDFSKTINNLKDKISISQDNISRSIQSLHTTFIKDLHRLLDEEV